MLNEEHFTKRLRDSNNYTNKAVGILKSRKHFLDCQPTPGGQEEDKRGIDFWVRLEDEDGLTPIQYKVRDRHDFQIVIKQPFWGVGDSRTLDGRDWRCLKNHTTKYHYMAIVGDDQIQRIYRCPSEFLHRVAKAVIAAWESAPYCLEYFTPSVTEHWIKNGPPDARRSEQRVFVGEGALKGCEVWWKKNGSENFPKFLLYIPAVLLKTEVLYPDKDECEEMTEEMFDDIVSGKVK